MGRSSDCSPASAQVFFLPVQTRVPLKFGPETLTSVTCARVRLTIRGSDHREAEGWGETPLSVQWVWPASATYAERHEALKIFTQLIAKAWVQIDARGHPLEISYDFQRHTLPALLTEYNRRPDRRDAPMPWLAALVCFSPFDLALHDAYGCLHQQPVYRTYNANWMSRDLAEFLEAEKDSQTTFRGRYPESFLIDTPPFALKAWHLVGGLDPLTTEELTGSEPRDGHPVLLADWIQRDGLTCLKVKLRGNDAGWDYARFVATGRLGLPLGIDWLSADFNCTVKDPAYVNEILDQLRRDEPRLYGMLLYVEQPFPYELERHQIHVRSVAARKPLYLDESAHDWQHVRLGRSLGWSGVALKTCKTQTGALLSACWAKAHGMELMVQDLTNPMLAQIPHVQLAAHVGTIMGVETNSMQFYPEASKAEAAVHPGLFQRRHGQVHLNTISGPGFGYRIPQIHRPLPSPDFSCNR